MQYYAISTNGDVIDLEGRHHNYSDALSHAKSGPWDIAGIFTAEQLERIHAQIKARQEK